MKHSKLCLTSRGLCLESARRLMDNRQWRTGEFCSGRGVQHIQFEDRGQRERGSGVGSPP